ncbi:hypothetical protein GCM10010347_18700 [Streptomyces cirratus]|uniref:Uncharacterized protein n=1 Tax=Streptomyces cirratus TaxID=68187 RepID=A0ABQ3EPC8_9ACTN|nr:hypothetical protein GCM10010347_18700 [Streptomyces cirratus]
MGRLTFRPHPAGGEGRAGVKRGPGLWEQAPGPARPRQSVGYSGNFAASAETRALRDSAS